MTQEKSPLPPTRFVDLVTIAGRERRYAEEVALSNERRRAALPQRDADHDRVQALDRSRPREARLAILGSGHLEDGYAERVRRGDRRRRRDEDGVRELDFERPLSELPAEAFER